MAVRERLQDVERFVLEQACPDAPALQEVATYLARGGGKRFRPALLLICAHLGSSFKPEAIGLAAAIEWLHTATLYHDDVMDEADQRRFRASANHLWGNRMAVIAGSYLYARAAMLFTGSGAPVSRIFSETALDVWQGQMLETEITFNPDVDEKRYLTAIEKKTAVLCELPCHIGALLADLPAATVESLCLFGRSVGVAFQLVDDLIDLFGDPAQSGKPTITDLREGVYTLPVIYALQDGAGARRRLRDFMARCRPTALGAQPFIRWLRTQPATRRAVDQVYLWLQVAKQHLHDLPPGELRRSLNNFADLVVGQRIPEDLRTGSPLAGSLGIQP
jgi:heptaprenyl diphosphate synthase